jgi:hypothetical protein
VDSIDGDGRNNGISANSSGHTHGFPTKWSRHDVLSVCTVADCVGNVVGLRHVRLLASVPCSLHYFQARRDMQGSGRLFSLPCLSFQLINNNNRVQLFTCLMCTLILQALKHPTCGYKQQDYSCNSVCLPVLR